MGRAVLVGAGVREGSGPGGERGCDTGSAGPGQGHRRGHAGRRPHPRRGPQGPSASACPAHGRRFAPARPGAGLSGLCGTGLSDALPHGRGNAVRFLIRPGPAEAIAEVMGERSHLPAEGPQGPRPAPDPRSEGASRPPGQALASAVSRGTGHPDALPHGRGTCCAISSAGPRPFRSSPTRPTTSRAPSSVRPPAQAATRRPKRRWHRRRPDTL